MLVPLEAVKRLPVLHHSADYIFISFRIIGPLYIFENGVLLICKLEGVGSVANFITAYKESQ